MLNNLMEDCSILGNVIEFDGRLLNFSGDKKKHYCPQFGYQETISKKQTISGRVEKKIIVTIWYW